MGKTDLQNSVWGTPGAPLLPASLRAMWSEILLPDWVLKETQLQIGSTMSDLDNEVWNHMGSLTEPLKGFLVKFVNQRQSSIANVVAVNALWPQQLVPEDIPWKTRTRNCLYNGLLRHGRSRVQMYERLVNKLHEVTFGELYRLRNMGTVSVLDFSCSVEGVLGRLGIETTPTSESQSAQQLPNDEVQAIAVENWVIELIDQAWPERITVEDPRFADIMFPRQGSLAEEIQRKITGETEDLVFGSEVSLEQIAREARKEVQRIAESPLEEQLMGYMHSLVGYSGKRLEALLGRFGWAGRPPTTLEEAGNSIGLTRERIRQMQRRAEDRMPEHPVVMPGLDQAIEVLEEKVPLSFEEASELLVRKGITCRPFHPCSVLAAAAMCGRQTDLEISYIKSRGILHSRSGSAAVGKISRIAIRLLKASGTASIFHVAERLKDKGVEADDVGIREVLETIGVEFLGEDWYCLSGIGGAALETATQKMLSVASPISVGELREGLHRVFRFRTISGNTSTVYFVPPRHVLQACYDRHPDFIVDQDGRVSSTETLDYRQELTEIEQALVRVLRRSPACLMDRSALIGECMAEGVKKNTANVLTTFSPLLKHVGTDLWSLRGVSLDPAVVEGFKNTKGRQPKKTRLIDFGWSLSGKLWLAIRVPPKTYSDVFLIPSPIRRFLVSKQFAAITSAGRAYGTITVGSEGYSWGYADFIERSGADEGDVLQVEFDLSTQAATLGLRGPDEDFS